MDYDVRFVVVRLADVGFVDVGIMLVTVRLYLWTKFEHYVIFVIYVRCL